MCGSKFLRFLLIFPLLLALETRGQVVLWSEDFNSYSDGTQTGSDNNAPTGADWSVSCVGCDAGDDYAKYTPTVFYTPIAELFLVSSDNVITWTSESIDISATGKAVIELAAWSYGTETDDQMRCYYNVDGAGDVLFYEVNEETEGLIDNPGSAVVNGNNVVITVEFINDGGGLQDCCFGSVSDIPNDDGYGIDDITVISITDLYSAGSGNWNTAGNWETAPGAADAAGPPTGTIFAHIEAGDAIVTTTNVTAAGLEILSGGQLTINGANTLNINYGSTLTVEAGAALTTTNPASNINLVSESSYTFHVDGALTIGSINVGDNQSTNFLGNGAYTIQDNLILSDDGQITNNATSALNVQGQVEFDASTDGALFTNNSTVNITDDLFFNNNNSGFINHGVLSVTADIFANEEDDNNYVTNTGTFSLADIEINNANISINNSGTINQSGNFGEIDTGSDFNNLDGAVWNYAGTAFDNSLSTVLNCLNGINDFNYTSPSAQNIINTQYVNLGMDGGGVNTLQGNTDVSNTLFLNTSRVSLGNFNLSIGNNASISGGSNSSFVVTDGTGNLSQNNIGSGGKTGGVLFPVGRFSTDYTPLTIDNTSGAADDFFIRVCSNVYEEGGCESGTLVADLVLDRTWFITEGNPGGSDADITFQWNATNEVGSFDRSNVDLIHYTGTEWEGLATVAASGSDPYFATIPGATDFSPFTVQDGDSPLPVDLVKFEAHFVNESVLLNWTTASEINNDYFVLERAINLKDFEEISMIDGNGTTNKDLHYEYADVRPYGGTSYYRLTQVDFDGTKEIHPPVKVEVPLASEIQAMVFPIPSEGDYLNLQLSGFDKSLSTRLQIINVKGESVYEQDLYLDKDTGFNQTIQFSKKLKSGIYILNISTPQPIIKRIMIK